MRGLWSGKRAELVCPMLGLAEPEQENPRGSSATIRAGKR
jgi:hypothetical protein